MSFIDKLKSKLKMELGINKVEEENKSLYFLLNNCIDITKLPKTKDPDLLALQKCDTLLLAIFDKVCEKHGLSYWLSFGSLLGAYRHQGFIPWDDDLDVCMPRDDVEKMFANLKEGIESYGLTLKRFYFYPIRGIVLSYEREKTGVWLDVFSVDTFSTDKDADFVKERIKRYRERQWKTESLSYDELFELRKSYLAFEKKGKNEYLIPEVETWKGNSQIILSTPEEIFPLSRVKFEEYSFYAPAKVETYLTKSYGDNYMQFPHIAINSHGSKDSIVKRAKKNGINMEDVYNLLMEIYHKVS